MSLSYVAEPSTIAGVVQRIVEHSPKLFESSIQNHVNPMDQSTVFVLTLANKTGHIQRKSYRVKVSEYEKRILSDDWKEQNNEFIDFVNDTVEQLWPTPKEEEPVAPSANDWDKRMLRLAAGEINSWSKDPSTKVSATVFRGKYPIAMSYNGFPPGIADTDERLNNRELKYKLVQHAEANAISTCSKLGISTEGTTMAVTLFPCSTCAGLMISAGIKKVIVQEPTPELIERWGDSFKLSKDMFEEAGIEVVTVDLNTETP